MTDPSLADRITALIAAVPRGSVVTYGQVAAEAGNPRAARLVVWVLNSRAHVAGLPWHRVVNARGGISLQGEGGNVQRALLEAEGVEFDAAGRIDLRRFGTYHRVT